MISTHTAFSPPDAVRLRAMLTAAKTKGIRRRIARMIRCHPVKPVIVVRD